MMTQAPQGPKAQGQAGAAPPQRALPPAPWELGTSCTCLDKYHKTPTPCVCMRAGAPPSS